MTRPARQVTRRSPFKWLGRAVGYLAGAAALPLLVGGLGVASHATAAPAPSVDTLPAPPEHDPTRHTAVIVAGPGGAESIDVLVPYELLAASGAFNVYTVAPERRPLPLFPGTPTLQGTHFVPHFSFADFDEQVTTTPDVVVVPFIPSPDSADNAALRAWLRRRVTADTALLTICGGSWVAAEAGLLDGRAATNHQNVLPFVRRAYPAVDWVDGQRWVQDGNVISSAGITAAFDATLQVVDELIGREAALDTAQRVGYPHTVFLDDPAYAVPAADKTAGMLARAYRWDRDTLGVALYDGVGEVEVASIVDLYPRTFGSTIQPISSPGGIVTTRHGLHLVAHHRPQDNAALERILVPGAPPAGVDLAGWAAARNTPVEHVHRDADGRFAIDAVLHDLERQDTRAAAALVARGIEYPVVLGDPAGRSWPYELLLRPLLLALLGLLATVGMVRWWTRRRDTA